MRLGPNSSRLRDLRAISLLGPLSIEIAPGRRPGRCRARRPDSLPDHEQRFSDVSAIEIAADDFHVGGLRKPSFARPGKLFTAHFSLITSVVGELELDKFDEILDAIIELFQTSKQS